MEGLDKASLKVAVWKGNVTLTDVVLRREAFYSLGLPVNIKSGSVSRITATIPWSKLGSEPVSLTLDGVYLVAGPLDEGHLDEGAMREWTWARKQQRLDAHLPGALQQLANGAEALHVSSRTRLASHPHLGTTHLGTVLGQGHDAEVHTPAQAALNRRLRQKARSPQ